MRAQRASPEVETMNSKVEVSVDLTTACVLARLSRRSFSYTKRDKVAEAIIDREVGGRGGKGSFLKRVMDRSLAHQIVDEAYQAHQRLTMPSQIIRGAGILPVGLMQQYSETIGAFQEALPKAVEDLVRDLETVKAHRREVLGDLYREEEYPSAEELRESFAIEFRLLPFPSITDEIAGAFGSAVAEQMRQGMREAAREVQRGALMDLVQRVREICARAATGLQEGSRFHQSTLDQLTQLGELVPQLNLWGDPIVERAGEVLRTELRGLDGADLRKDKGAKGAAQKAAQEVVDQLAGYAF